LLEGERSSVADCIGRDVGDERPNNATAHEHTPLSRDDVYVDVGSWVQAGDTVDEHA
jgi:hypothetical protein